MLYADDLFIISLSLASLQQCFLNVTCSTKHFITFNVNKSVSMFFKTEVNIKCNATDMILSNKAINFVRETKYLSVTMTRKIRCTSHYAVEKLY